MPVESSHSKFRAVTQLSVIAFLSPVSGVLAEMTLASIFGASSVVDAYRIAYIVIAMGNQVFLGIVLPNILIPLLSTFRTKNANADAWNAAFSLGYLLFAVCLSLAIAIWERPDYLVALLAPDLSAAGKAEAEKMLSVFGLLLACTIWIGIMNAILQSYRVLWTAPVTQLATNAFSIFFVLLLGRSIGGRAISSAILCGTVAGLCIHVILLRSIARSAGVHLHQALFPRWTPAIRKALKFGIPTLALVVLSQWTIIAANRSLAALPMGSLANFGYAFKLMIVIGFVPAAFTTFIFPALSESSANNDAEHTRSLATRSARMILTVTMPVTVLLYVARYEIIGLLFQRGALHASDVEDIAQIFAVLVWSAPFSHMLNFLCKINYASFQSKEAFAQLLFVAVMTTLTMSFAANHDGARGVALAFTLIYLVAALLHGSYIIFCNRRLDGGALVDFVWRMALICVVFAAAHDAARTLLYALAPENFLGRSLLLVIPSGASFIAFLLISSVIPLPEVAQIKRYLWNEGLQTTKWISRKES